MTAAEVVAGRVALVRQFCQDQIEYDKAQKLPEGCLTDRQWTAQSVLNILNGLIDEQVDDPDRAS